VTLTIPAAVHGLRASRDLLVQAFDASTGAALAPGVQVAANGDVTLTFQSAVAANAVRTVIVGPLR
jgi:hypothetical protein